MCFSYYEDLVSCEFKIRGNMISHIQIQECATQTAEKMLKAKIYLLQDQMANFNRQLQTAAQNVEKSNFSPVTDFQPYTWLSTGAASAGKVVCRLLCLLMYVTWPLLLPLLVYYREGSSFFFWKLFCLAILYAAAFTLKVVLELKEVILQLIIKVFSEAKTHCNNCCTIIANLKSFLCLWTERMTQNSYYGLKDCNSEVLLIERMPAVGYIVICLLLCAVVIITIMANMAYFPSGIIFSAGFVSGLIMRYLNLRRNSLLPVISQEGKNNAVPEISYQCSEGCAKLCCHTAANTFCKINLPRTPPPTYQEALRSSFKVDFSSGRRSLFTAIL